MDKIRIGILGYGNLGKGVELAIGNNPDMELVAIFTRREPKNLITLTDVKVESVEKVEEWKDKIDVMILCGGSATDLPEQGPEYAKIFNTIDSFDTHAKIPEYFKEVNKSAQEAGKISLISIGWDPGTFSLNRLYSECFLPEGNTYTFWGKGVSQGHSDAIRRIAGVKNAVQYTIPMEEAVSRVKSGENPELTVGEKHLRECFVVLEEGADAKKVEEEIKTMPNYFADYKTIVNFITEEGLKKEHNKMPHGGFVIRSGKTGKDNKNNQIIEYSLNLESNPEFTSSILVAYARALYRLSKKGETGARTILDIPPRMLSPKTDEEILKEIL
ncbi:MAG: diaminopimelate dehydrogenase [Clostridiales bacterium]|nr:diaminopimelate dehydrogenase [Clostridiales bacterium]